VGEDTEGAEAVAQEGSNYLGTVNVHVVTIAKVIIGEGVLTVVYVESGLVIHNGTDNRVHQVFVERGNIHIIIPRDRGVVEDKKVTFTAAERLDVS
jgi:hypothetical protein